MRRQPLVAGNWKMHGSRASAQALVAGVAEGCTTLDVDVVLLPPFVLIPEVVSSLGSSRVQCGAQHVGAAIEGPYTGEVSPRLLREFGCRHALVGHSERRQLFGESDASVAERAVAALGQGLQPIVCLGETKEEREQDRTRDVVLRQLGAVLDQVPARDVSRIVLAYEPVWAIGTGLTASPEQAQDVHRALRDYLRDRGGEQADQVRILYGGSMKPDNADALLRMPDIDGGLIGGASLVADSFVAICAAADRLRY